MGMESQRQLRIPHEIFEFFNKPGGHSLILRGLAGAGKTTFALQVIEDLSDLEHSYYISTRVSDASLFSQFPWLRNRMGEAVVEKEQDERRSRLNDLKGYGGDGIGLFSGKMSVSIGRELQDIESIYDAVEKNLPNRSLVVIDSIDALAEKYEMPCSRLINTIQKDVVEGFGSSALFVLECADSQLDYIGDGVVILNASLYQRRRIREMDILKLRGCEIEQPKYLFTLKGGKIQCFAYDSENPPPGTRWNPIEEKGSRISSGIMDLDRLLDGGLERGSITLIELKRGIPISIIRILEQSLVANFISQDRGVLWVPTRKASPEAARKQMLEIVEEEQFDRLVRTPVSATIMGVLIGKHIMTVEGENASDDFNWKNIAYSLQGANSPFLSLIGLDSMESIYRGDLMDQLMGHLASMKSNEGIFVGIASPSTRSTQRLADLANVHLKVDRIGGTVIIYGDEPFTGCNAITLEQRTNGGSITLTQIL
jgi:KaiC/GvpD/RAD55 family RecA-like ATPase